MKILFSGGGTLGPVTPLLALYENLKDQSEHEFLWVGTKNGPEKKLVDHEGIRFFILPESKLRRYFSLQTFTDIFLFLGAFFQSIVLLKKEKPDVCISAGGYVSVPIHWAAILLGIPTWIHQQDVVVGLANRLMSAGATLITLALEKTVSKFPKEKTQLLGNPVRPSIFLGSREEAFRVFSLDPHLPVIFATGGGTGSEKINVLVAQLAFELSDQVQIIHLTGKERKTLEPTMPLSHYHTYEFLDDTMALAYAAADIVISRGGFGTLSELSALSKAAIVIPKTGHQEENIAFCASAGAVISCNENTTTVLELADKVTLLLKDASLRHTLGQSLSSVVPIATASAMLKALAAVTKKK